MDVKLVNRLRRLLPQGIRYLDDDFNRKILPYLTAAIDEIRYNLSPTLSYQSVLYVLRNNTSIPIKKELRLDDVDIRMLETSPDAFQEYSKKLTFENVANDIVGLTQDERYSLVQNIDSTYNFVFDQMNLFNLANALFNNTTSRVDALSFYRAFRHTLQTECATGCPIDGFKSIYETALAPVFQQSDYFVMVRRTNQIISMAYQHGLEADDALNILIPFTNSRQTFNLTTFIDYFETILDITNVIRKFSPKDVQDIETTLLGLDSYNSNDVCNYTIELITHFNYTIWTPDDVSKVMEAYTSVLSYQPDIGSLTVETMSTLDNAERNGHSIGQVIDYIQEFYVSGSDSMTMQEISLAVTNQMQLYPQARYLRQIKS
jgi:hypothetical protein